MKQISFTILTLCFLTRFGWRLAKHVGLPVECTKVKVGECGVKFVKVKDEQTLCFEDQDLEYNSIPSRR